MKTAAGIEMKFGSQVGLDQRQIVFGRVPKGKQKRRGSAPKLEQRDLWRNG